MKPEEVIILLILLLIVGVIVMSRMPRKEGFDFIKPYTPSEYYVPSVTHPESGSPSMINENYDRIVHPAEVCVYREPRDRVGMTNPYGIGFSQNLAINRDTYLNVYDMYGNRLAKQCHPSLQGPTCDYLERTNPLFRGVSTFRKKPFEPDRLGSRAAKTIDKLKAGANPLDVIGHDGYYRPQDGPAGPNRPTEQFGNSPRAEYDSAYADPTSTAKEVSSYDTSTPSGLQEYKHYPKVLHPLEAAAYYDQRATYFKNPYKLGFSKSSIVNRDTYHDHFDKYERRQPALCHPSNLYPVLDNLRRHTTRLDATDRRTGSFKYGDAAKMNLTDRNRSGRNVRSREDFAGVGYNTVDHGVPSNDTWDLKDPRLCTELRVGCPRTDPKLPLKLYSKCYEHDRTRLVNPVIDVDPYQYY